MMYIKEEMIKPIITGGVIIGMLVFISPWIGGNRWCCVLYILSGIIAAHLLSQKYLLSDRDYLLSGALSGGVAGFVSWLLIIVCYVLDALLHGRLSIYSSLMDFVSLTIFLLINSLTPLLLGVTFGTIGAILHRMMLEGIIKNKKDRMAKSVLIGGVIGGVLFSFLPFSICILPYLLSGAITAYLMSKASSRSNADYIIAGGLSGGIAGLVSWGLDTLIILIDGILVMANYRSLDEIDMEIAMATDSLMMNIPFYILTGAIFGVIGGILYKKLKDKYK